jgi:glutamate carboxypeptidase
MDPIAEKISGYLRSRQDEMVDFLIQLVEAESPSLVPASQQEILTILADRLEALDYRIERIPGTKTGGHLLAMPRDLHPATPTQLLLGHCDTVWPLGTLAKMPVSLSEGRLKGPGVFDMKAGLAQIIFALEALRGLNLDPAVAPLVFINSDEEIGSEESSPHIISLAEVADRALILEPALGPQGKLKTARKSVGRFTITVQGKSAHAGLDPENGASAIRELAYLIQKVYALGEPDRGITVNVGVIQGGLRSNVVAPHSEAIVDVRVPTQADAHRLDSAFNDLRPTTGGVRIEIDGGFGRPPLERTPRNLALWEAARRAGQTMGLALEEGLAGGGSDGNTTSLYTATLDGLGPVGDGAHAEHEFIFVDQWVGRCALLALIVLSPPLTGH